MVVRGEIYLGDDLPHDEGLVPVTISDCLIRLKASLEQEQEASTLVWLRDRCIQMRHLCNPGWQVYRGVWTLMGWCIHFHYNQSGGWPAGNCGVPRNRYLPLWANMTTLWGNFTSS